MGASEWLDQLNRLAGSGMAWQLKETIGGHEETHCRKKFRCQARCAAVGPRSRTENPAKVLEIGSSIKEKLHVLQFRYPEVPKDLGKEILTAACPGLRITE